MMTGVNVSMDVESERDIHSAVCKWKLVVVSNVLLKSSGLVLKRAPRDGKR